jgi:transglutaminase-like putative cysteine protease
MLFAIQHHTHYRYNQPVVFEPHFLRFKPREDPFQKLLKFRISIKPEPAGISEQIDLDGNTIHQIWFNGLFQGLEVQSSALIETGNTNPFNYLVYPESALNLPMHYPQDTENSLKPYTTPATDSIEILQFAEEIANEADQQIIPFLMHLTRKINQEFQKQYRKVGEPYPPAKMLAEKKGACRDLAVLFMETCRALGFATRFVSGYYFDESSKNKQDLHSWVEVYIPGGGWRGFDPSIGLATTDCHIAVAASAIPHMTTPIVGAFQGKAESSLTTDIKVLSL